MKTVLFILALIAIATAQVTPNTLDNYEAKTCEELCDSMASRISKIIDLFINGFDFGTFATDLVFIINDAKKLPDVCEGDMWEAIVEIVLETLEDSLKGCGQAVVICIEDAVNFVFLFLDGQAPPAIVITRKILEIANAIVDAVDECTNNTHARFSEEMIQSCSVAVEAAYEPAMIEFQKGMQMNYFNLMAPAMQVKAACFDSMF